MSGMKDLSIILARKRKGERETAHMNIVAVSF